MLPQTLSLPSLKLSISYDVYIMISPILKEASEFSGCETR